jgi:hypothetical protein
MDRSELLRKLRIALAVFLDQHRLLLTKDANERSIAHKFAECLECLFPWWDIDCEYNRHGDQEKRLVKVKNYVREKRKSGVLTDKEEDFGICVSPDVIVHKRYNDDSNLLIVEIKKSDHPLNEKEYDFLKICSYIREIKYHYGLYLEFGVKDDAGTKRALLFLPGSVECEDITKVLCY